MKQRLDTLLFYLKLVRSRSEASDLIKRGKVRVNGKIIEKTSAEFSPEDKIEIHDVQYVSRGAYKLLKALQEFKVEVKEKYALDIGSSTGGFTEVLIEHGTKHVYAVDSGTDQLAQSLKDDTRVTTLEKTDIRNIDKEILSHDISIIVIDVSFISLSIILPTVVKLITSPTDIILLFKPQFEVGKEFIGKNGIVKNEKVIEMSLHKFRQSLKDLHLNYISHIESPIKGGSGNTEYLFHIKSL
jgi:23S rRNA (cytidine1920-2'-O)/16S rRNA (cytidine1409-2'-O)-methyltransferase